MLGYKDFNYSREIPNTDTGPCITETGLRAHPKYVSPANYSAQVIFGAFLAGILWYLNLG